MKTLYLLELFFSSLFYKIPKSFYTRYFDSKRIKAHSSLYIISLLCSTRWYSPFIFHNAICIIKSILIDFRLTETNCLLLDVLEAVRPHVNLTFDNILAHINTIYVLKTKVGALAEQGYLRLKVASQHKNEKIKTFTIYFYFFFLYFKAINIKCSFIIKPIHINYMHWNDEF